MKNSKLVVAAFAALSLTAGQAIAQDEPDGDGMGGDPCGGEMHEGDGMAMTNDGTTEPGPATEEDGGTMAAPPMLTPMSKLNIHVGVGLNLGSDAIAKPITITPDIFYGIKNRLEIGIAHSSAAITGFWGQSDLHGGLCVTGTDSGCAKVYNGPVAALVRFGLSDGGVEIAADAGVVIANLSDPNALGVKLGVRGRKISGKILFGFAPNIYVGLTNRSFDTNGVSVDFNKEVLNVPVDVHFMATDKVGIGVQSGISGPLSGFGDSFKVPLSVGAMFIINQNMSAGAAVTLHRVAGGGDGGAADARSLGVFFGWHN